MLPLLLLVTSLPTETMRDEYHWQRSRHRRWQTKMAQHPLRMKNSWNAVPSLDTRKLPFVSARAVCGCAVRCGYHAAKEMQNAQLCPGFFSTLDPQVEKSSAFFLFRNHTYLRLASS